MGHDSVGPGVEGEEWVREPIILGLGLGWFVVSTCEGGIACAGSHDPQLTQQLSNFSKARTRCDPSLDPTPNTRWAQGEGSLKGQLGVENAGRTDE